MELNTLKEKIQEFFQENTVTIVGSGLSAAEGIPGMNNLAKYLIDKIPSRIANRSDDAVWEKISAALAAGEDLESALLHNAPTERLEIIIRDLTAGFVGEAERRITKEAIQGRKTLRFSEYLDRFNLRNDGITVITPNYDRLIEYACEFNKVRVDTMFIGNYFAHFNPNQSKYMFCEGRTKHSNTVKIKFAPRVTLFKPHGCLSWHMIDGEPYSIPDSSVEGSLIITPGLNKYHKGYSTPFDVHRARANDAIDAADRFIVIGYGFNDDHLETHLVRQLQCGKPALIISRSLREKTRDLVKQNNNIIGICRGHDEGTEVLTSRGQYFFDDINLWDLHEMIREVF